MYTVWDYDASTVVARGAQFPRKGVTEAMRRDPSMLIDNCPPDLKGPAGERYGWLREVVAQSSLSTSQKAGDPVYADPDFDAGTVAVTIPAVSKTQAEIVADLAALRATAKSAVNAERDRRVYLPIGQVDVRGDGTLMVEPDVRNDRDRANLGDLHSKSLSLAAAGVTAAVIPLGAADNVEYTLTPAEMMKIAEAPLDRASALFVAGRALKNSIDGMNTAQIAALDVTADSHWAGGE
jgi:hypothetical protein